MPRLVLGPLLRYVDHRQATVWVETDAPCRVEVLGATTRTFEVSDHHYAVVFLRDLEPGREYRYEVALDGTRVWPDLRDAGPGPSLRPPSLDAPLRVAFGSCLVSAPHRPPFTLQPDDDARGVGVSALHALAARMRDQPRDMWPDLLLLLGDQVYADDLPPELLDSLAAPQRASSPHGHEVANFEEYTELYRYAWQDPDLRWLLATLPTAMIWDDHDVHDDWNTSYSWLREVREEAWWAPRIEGAIASYWLYQHIGNVSPAELEHDEVWQRTSGGDGGRALHEFARRAARESTSARWSFARELGRTRLVVIDSRASRVLDAERRDMLDDTEWAWLERQLQGGVDHLLVATSLPALLPEGVHQLEAWNEAVCAGAWGRRAARFGERVRRALDLEHWAAFDASLRRLLDAIADVAAGRRGDAPASIVLLSGDVHHSYLADVAFPRRRQVRSAVYQAVSSPLRHPLATRERKAVRVVGGPAGAAIFGVAARLAGVPQPPARWRICAGPWFDNALATLVLAGRRADLAVEHPGGGAGAAATLTALLTRRLA